VPIHKDRLLFEMLILEGAQARLSWSTILRKRVPRPTPRSQGVRPRNPPELAVWINYHRLRRKP
jgi:hypothetical protein